MCSTNPKQRWREIQCSWTTVIRPTSFLTMHVWSQAIELNWTIITPGRLQQQLQFTKSSHLGKSRKNHKKSLFATFVAKQIFRVAYWNDEGIPHLIRICYEWICQFATSSTGVAWHAIQCIVGGHTLYKWEGTHVLLRSTSTLEWVICVIKEHI